MEITTIIILVLILLVIIAAVGAFFFFKSKLENLSRNVFGTSNIFEGFKNQELEYSETPKSVSSMDSVIIPKIHNDFPHLDVNELKEMAETTVNLYYESLSKKKVLRINHASDTLLSNLSSKIEELKNSNITYSNIKFHRTVINSYTNKKGHCLITFQSSLEYISKSPKSTTKIQDRVNIDLIYVYDETTTTSSAVSLNCPNCGAPVKDLGTKSCSYCGTGLVEFTKKTWKVNDIYQK